MDTISIALPPDMRDFVESQVARGQYASADDYVRTLIRADQERQVKDGLEAEILKGLRSGPATPMTAEDWAGIRREFLARSRGD